MGGTRGRLMILGVIGVLNSGFASAQNGISVTFSEPVGSRSNPCNGAIVTFDQGGHQITVTRLFKDDGSDQFIFKVVTSAKGEGTSVDPATMDVLVEDYMVNEEIEQIVVDTGTNTTTTILFNEHVISKSRTRDFTSHEHLHITFQADGFPTVVVQNGHSSCP